MSRRWLLLMPMTLVCLTAILLHALPAHAAFIANDLVDDNIFDNSNSMGSWDTTDNTGAPGAINNWLNANFPHSCISTNNGFTAPDPNGYHPGSGYSYGGPVSAGRVVSDAAHAYGINPQVLLATLEKESSIVTGNASYHCQYINTAMGYDCPDSGSCPQNPATESGFSQQVIHAAWLFRFHEQRSEGNVGWNQSSPGWDNSDDPQACFSGRMTQGRYQICPGGGYNTYDGYTTIDGTTVHLDTGATAALYDYTPHFHGNQLFDSIFTGWFGSPTGELQQTSDGSIYIVNGNTKYPISDIRVYNDFSNLGLRAANGGALPGSTGTTIGHMVQGPDGTLYFVNANIKLPFTSCNGDVVDYGYTCAANQYAPLDAGQVGKLANGPPVTNLIKSNASNTVYYLQNGRKRPINTLNDMHSFHQGLNVYTNTMVDQFTPGSTIYGIGSLVKTAGSASVYMSIDDNPNTLLSIGSFVYPQEFGLSTAVQTIPNDDFANYDQTTPPAVTNKVSCNGTNYVGTNGVTYPVPSSINTAYGFSGYVSAGKLCSNLNISAQPLSQYIRVSSGVIYYVSGGQKRAFSSYATYQSAPYCNNTCTYDQVSDFFASSIPSGSNL